MKYLISAIACSIVALSATAQLKVGANPTSISSGAILQADASGTRGAFYLPRVTLTSTTDITTVASPQAGFTVYNTATAGTSPNNVTPGYYYYDGTQWQKILSSAAVSNAWTLTGNAVTTPPTQINSSAGSANFVGTTDAKNLAIGTNNTTRMIFDQNGNAYGGAGSSYVAPTTAGAFVWGNSADSVYGTANAAAVFGSTNKVTGRRGITAGNGNSIPIDAASDNLVAGTNNTDSAFRSMVVGFGNILGSSSQESIVGGNNNVLSSNSYSGLVSGGSNKVYNHSSIIAGDGNIDSAKGSLVVGGINVLGANASHSIVGGNSNVLSQTANSALVVGGSNQVYGYAGIIGGVANIDSAYQSLLVGNLNVLGSTANQSIIFGNNNKSFANQTIVGGVLNTVYGSSVFVQGMNNIDSADNSVTIGQVNKLYSAATNGAAFGISNQLLNANAFAAGNTNTASGTGSGAWAIGSQNTASGDRATAMGNGMTVSGAQSFGINLNPGTAQTLAQANSMSIMGGKVGIGTAAPGYNLDVNGTAKIATLPAYTITNNTDAFVVTDQTTGQLKQYNFFKGGCPVCVVKEDPTTHVVPNGTTVYGDANGNYTGTLVLPVAGRYVGDMFTFSHGAQNPTTIQTTNTTMASSLTINTMFTGGASFTWNGTAWMLTSSAGAAGGGTSNWTTTGNAGTAAATNFIGTTDDQDLVFKRNGVPAGLLNNALQNTSFGVNGLNAATTGNYNTALGAGVLASNTTGYFNVATGAGALFANNSGYNNTANGYNALGTNTSGNSNSATGDGTLYKNTTGNNNTGNGYNNLFANTSGNNNTATGYNALAFSTTGNNNTALGYNAANTLTAGSNNIAIGAATDLASSAGSNQMNIGNVLFGTGLTGTVAAPAGSIGIGTTAPITTLQVNGSFAAGVTRITTSGAYTILATDYMLHFFFTGTGTATLPAAASNTGRVIYISNHASGAITTGTYRTANGTTVTTVAAGIMKGLMSDGTEWFAIN